MLDTSETTNEEFTRKVETMLDEQAQNIIEKFSESGQAVYDIYKGLTLRSAGGKMSDLESLALGHFGGRANVILNALIMFQDNLNKISSMDAELIKCTKKTSKGIVPITDKQEAELLHPEYEVVQTDEGLFYFYPGYTHKSRLLQIFSYGVARASGSYAGETKKGVLESLSQIKQVPFFPAQQPFGSQFEQPEQLTDKDDEEE